MQMPVLSTTDRAMPRSALRHRPIKSDADRQGKHPATMTGITPVAQRASRLRSSETEEDATAPGTSSTSPCPNTPRMKRRGVLRLHPLVFLAIGMIVMLALWALLTLAVSWWSVKWDDIQYGRPRTFQADVVVGHNDSAANPSHFIAMNLKGRIEIIEFPGGDGSKAHIYIGPQLYGAGSDLVPVTLSFVDVNRNGQPDMLVHFENTQIVFVNENGGFRPATSQELPAIQRYLQQHGQ
jgi:hypothetical protein